MVSIEKTSQVSDVFMKWLVREVKSEILANTNVKKLARLTEHAEIVFNTKIDIFKAFFMIVNNIEFTQFEGYYVIQVNPFKYFNHISLIDLYNYISFGDLQVNGYPIIHDTLVNIKPKLKRYLFKYKLVGVT